MSQHLWRGRRIVVCVVLCLTGCASDRYLAGKPDQLPGQTDVARRVSEGGPSRRLDRFERVLESPSRLPFIPDPPVDRPGPKTMAALEEYLDENGIHDVHIAISEYAPRDDWKRLRENRQMGAFWKYPLGAISCTFHALLPARVFDRTTYNPYTNTLVLNSDDPVEVLAAAAYAKNLRSQRLRGAYALGASLPLVSMVQTVDSTNEVLTYARHRNDWTLEQEGYRGLYPRLGAEGAVSILSVPSIFLRPVVMLGGGLIGRSVAEVQIRRLEGTRPQAPAPLAPESTARPLIAESDRPETTRVTPVEAVFQEEGDLPRVVFPEEMLQDATGLD